MKVVFCLSSIKMAGFNIWNHSRGATWAILWDPDCRAYKLPRSTLTDLYTRAQSGVDYHCGRRWRHNKLFTHWSSLSLWPSHPFTALCRPARRRFTINRLERCRPKWWAFQFGSIPSDCSSQNIILYCFSLFTGSLKEWAETWLACAGPTHRPYFQARRNDQKTSRRY